MALTDRAINVLTRPLPEDKIKSRPGGGGMKFRYIAPDFVIETLNEAFQYGWSSRIFYQDRFDDTVIVGLELTVPDENGNMVLKQQFGSCDITKGLGVGEAFKGAASDAMKKAATLLGLGLELYQDEAPAGPSGGGRTFTPPPSKPAVPAAPVSVPRPAGQPPFPPKPAGPAAPKLSAPVAVPQRPAAPAVPAPRSAPAIPPAPPKPQRNPFSNSVAEGAGPNTTQLNSLINIAAKKSLSHAALIGLANIQDQYGQPVQSFEQLTYNQAISVIQAAQRV